MVVEILVGTDGMVVGMVMAFRPYINKVLRKFSLRLFEDFQQCLAFSSASFKSSNMF